MVDDAAASLAQGRPELGFSTRYAQLLVMGGAFVVLGGFLSNLVSVSDNPSESMLHFAQWSSWLGAMTMCASLILAGVTGIGASPGLRTALILGGTYILLTVSSSVGFLANLFGF